MSASATQIQKYVGGATGKRGFLKWVEATFPAPIASHVLATAAAKSGTLGRFGRLGDVTTDALQPVSVTASYLDTTPSANQAASDTSASSSWLSSIGNALSTAISAAGQAYLTKTQIDAQQQIINTNLARAAQGLAPIPYTQQQLGLTGPTLNVGLTGSTSKTLLLLGGGIAAVLLITGALGRGSRR